MNALQQQCRLHAGKIPFFHEACGSTTFCFIPGFRSSFQASKKSLFLYDYARQHGVGFLAWDPQGEHSIEDWCQQGYDVVKAQLLQQPASLSSSSMQQEPLEPPEGRKPHQLVLVGSSMGAMLALDLAQRLRRHHHREIRVAGLIALGGALQVVDRWRGEMHAPDAVVRDGFWLRPSQYASEGYYKIATTFVDRSKDVLLPSKEDVNDHNAIDFAIDWLHGAQDHDVPLFLVSPWLARLRAAQVTSDDAVRLHLIADGDHRLSRPQDLQRLGQLLRTWTEHSDA